MEPLPPTFRARRSRSLAPALRHWTRAGLLEATRLRLLAAILLLPALDACGDDGRRTEAASKSAVTFNQHIAPLVLEKCARCHRPGEMAPFSLLTYEDVSWRADLIADVTARRYMPPWLPVAGHGEFAGDRTLSDEEIALFSHWIESGLQEGEPGSAPPEPKWTEGWQLGEPDLILSMPEYGLSADGPDVFRNFVIPVPVVSTRWVEAVEFRPTNRRVVHHAVIQIDEHGASRHLDEEDPEPGYEGMFARNTSHHPDGFFIGWTPGKLPRRGVEGAAWPVNPGTDLVFQLHLRPMGRSEEVGASIGLYFSDAPPDRTPVLVMLGSRAIDIPAGATDYTIEDSYVLPVDVRVLGVYPHAHFLGKRMEAFADLPGGKRQWLIRIDDWDFNWQDDYRYARPVFLPQGTTLRMHFTYDNSAENPRNPSRPPKRVVYGPSSSDEMGDLILQVLPANAADLATLRVDFARKYREYEVAGLEQMIRLDRDHRIAHFNLGNVRTDEGSLQEAVGHYREALRVDPEFTEAHLNLGKALQLSGDVDAAILSYRRAIALRPDYTQAHYNLGLALRSQGDLDAAIGQYRLALEADTTLVLAEEKLAEALKSRGDREGAIAHYRRVLELNPDLARAHRSLGITLAEEGYIEPAIDQLREAIRLAPDSPIPLITLAELLATHPDPSIREPHEAVRLAELAAGMTNYGHPVPLDALAAAYASAGRFDEAAETAELALRLAYSAGERALTERIRSRLELYRQRRPSRPTARAGEPPP